MNSLLLERSTEYIWSDTERCRFYTLSSHCSSGSETTEHPCDCGRMCQTGRLRSGTSLWLLHGSDVCGNYVHSSVEIQISYNCIILCLLLVQIIFVNHSLICFSVCRILSSCCSQFHLCSADKTRWSEMSSGSCERRNCLKICQTG